MTHWKRVPADLQDRLDEIANVLDEARQVRHSFEALGDIGQESRAAYEIKWARVHYNDDSVAMRLHRLVQLWGVMAAEMLAGIAALCREGEVIFAPFPLGRSAFEYCNRIVWVLDNRPDVTPQRRFARVLLEELLSAEEMCKAASHLGGKGSEPHKIAREELADVRQQALVVDQEAKVMDSPWTIAGEKLSSPTATAASFGERWGDARLSEGVYDALSAYSHPTLLGLDFYEVLDGQAVLTTDRETVDKFVSHALIPYYQALRHHMAYNGRHSDEFDKWEADVMAAFPGMIT